MQLLTPDLLTHMIWLILLAVIAYLVYHLLSHGYVTENQVRPEQPQPSSPSNSTQPRLFTVPSIQVPQTTTSSPRDQIANVVQNLDWCNEITKLCWPYIGTIVEEQLETIIEPLVNVSLPKPFTKFKIVSASLGKDPLRVEKVIVYKRYKDCIALDLDVQFRGTPNIKMKCAPLTATFGIKELVWSGRLAILMKPLITYIPLVGGIQAAMIDHPRIEMDFSGIANIADFGPIEKIVRAVLKNVTASMIVLPNRFTYKISDAIDFFDVYCSPSGVMQVTIERGRGFVKEKRIGMIKSIPDLYCRATFGLEEMKTDVVWNDLQPSWNVTKSFILSDIEQPFKLKCLDKDRLSKDDLIGSLTFTARDLMVKQRRWEKLQHDVAKVGTQAEILLSSTLYRFRSPLKPVSGSCVVTVLVAHARNLSPLSKAVACHVKVGNHFEKETPQVRKSDKPTLRMDPVNPTWNFSFDVICEDSSQAHVEFKIVDSGKQVGSAEVKVDELTSSPTKSREGNFVVAPNATLRAKVMLRCLDLNRSSNYEGR